MHFGEFNALDVLATAASLQTAGRGEGEQDDQSEGEGDADEGGEDGIARDAGPPTPIPGTYISIFVLLFFCFSKL